MGLWISQSRSDEHRGVEKLVMDGSREFSGDNLERFCGDRGEPVHSLQSHIDPGSG